MHDSLQIKLITNHKDYPYDLLLLADETIEAIDKYLYDSLVYIVFEGGNPIAVFCLYPLDSETLEIKNIAVSPPFQNKGLGSRLLNFIKTSYMEQYPNLIVGTADCGFDQIRFYERNGFVKYAVRKDFFVENYSRPIYEKREIIKRHDYAAVYCKFLGKPILPTKQLKKSYIKQHILTDIIKVLR